MARIHRSMSLLEWALLLALSVLWGGSFFFVGVAVKELPPLTIVVLRVGLAALALHLALRLLGLRMPAHRSAWLADVIPAAVDVDLLGFLSRHPRARHGSPSNGCGFVLSER
jgi:drug/metabolite transporter (DMT)-like permease